MANIVAGMEGTTPAEAAVLGRPARVRRRVIFGRDARLGYLLIAPAVAYIVLLVGYPFVLAIWFSVSNVTVSSGLGDFVAFANYANLVSDSLFRKALTNSLAFTFFSQIGKLVLGVPLAFLLLRKLPGKKTIRFFLMLPWTIPISLSLLGWRWSYDPQFSVINRFFGDMLHIFQRPYPDWLGSPQYAFLAVLIINIWRGFPFSAVVVLAGLTSIPQDIYDAARVDGAGFLRTWHYVITPMIAPILFIGLIFDLNFTLSDLTVVYLLTNGGPVNATDILPTVAFRTGILGGDLGRGAATALFLFPFILVAMVVVLRLLYRRQE